MALPDGVPDHAHRGFSTLTYLLPDSPGALSHEDFLGQASDSCAVQWQATLGLYGRATPNG